MLENVREITLENMSEQVYRIKKAGFRFVTITCTDLGDTFDLLYQFDKEYEFHNLRLALPKGEDAPSVSHIYFAAALVENEIQDLFNLHFWNMAVNFVGRFILSENAPKAPLAKTPGIGIDVRVVATPEKS